MRKTIVFDLDGTLLDTLEDLTNATNAGLHYVGMPMRDIEEVRKFVGNGVRNLMLKAVTPNATNEEFEEAFGYFRCYYEMHCKDKTKPYDGVLELMAELKKQGFKMAIVSNKLDSAVKELREQFFAEYVDVAIGDQEGLARKPEPDMVYEALKQLGSLYEDAIYIGDSEVDLKTAENSKLPCISVLWGFRDQEELEEAGGKCFAKYPMDVLRCIQEI